MDISNKMKLSQEHFMQLLNVVNTFTKQYPEFTWGESFMRVYRSTVDSSASNPSLLQANSTPDAMEIARKDYMEEVV